VRRRIPRRWLTRRSHARRLREQLKQLSVIYQSTAARLEQYRHVAASASKPAERALSLDSFNGQIALSAAVAAAAAVAATAAAAVSASEPSARGARDGRHQVSPLAAPVIVEAQRVAVAPSASAAAAAAAASASASSSSSKPLSKREAAAFVTPKAKKLRAALNERSWMDKTSDLRWLDSSPDDVDDTDRAAESTIVQRNDDDAPTCCATCRTYFRTLDGCLVPGECKRTIMERYSRRVHRGVLPATPPHHWEHMSLNTQLSAEPSPRVRPTPVIELKPRPLQSEVLGKRWWKKTKTRDA